MARAKHAHLPAVAHDLLHLPDRLGMVHAIGAEADVAGPVTKLHCRRTPVLLRVSKIPSSRPSCPRAGRRSATYGYFAANKHGRGGQPALWGLVLGSTLGRAVACRWAHALRRAGPGGLG